MAPRPRSISSLYSLSGASSLTSIISTPPNPSLSGSTSRSPSPFSFTPILTPSEFIFPIPSRGGLSETSPLLPPPHQYQSHKPCTCNHPNPNHTTHVLKATSTTQPSIQFRYCSTRRSLLLNIQIISCVLFLVSLAIIVLSPFSNRTESGTSTLERDLKSSHQHVSLRALHSPSDPKTTNPSIQAQTRTRIHKLDNPQLKGIEFAIVCFAIFTMCSIARATSYVMSRWGIYFGGERSDSNGGIFGDEEEMIGY